MDETINSFFDDDDEEFANALLSISDLETSSLREVSQDIPSADENGSQKQNCVSQDITSADENGSQKQNCVSQDITSADENGSQKQNSVSHPQLLSSICESSESNTCSDIFQSGHKRQVRNLTNMINSPGFEEDDVSYRFLPDCASKSRKRKLPDPFQMFLESVVPKKWLKDVMEFCNSDSNEKLGTPRDGFEDSKDDEFEVSTSQFATNYLFKTPSWKKLEEEVSSNQRFLSTVQPFSIKRTLDETSKIKLPKHVVVPVLCLFIKTYNSKDSLSTFMDDTGEITGRFDKESLELYGNCIKTGTSLILRKVVFICNIMMLDESNFVSIFLKDGTVHHIRNWETLLDDELSNSPACIFPRTPRLSEKPAKQCRMSKVHPKSVESLLSPRNPDFRRPHSSGNSNVGTTISNQPVEMDDGLDELLSNIDEKSFLDDF